MDDSNEKIYACKKATNNSNKLIMTAIGTAATEMLILPILIIIPKIASIIACPAVMFANNLTDNANGLVNKPINSTGIIMGSNHNGTPGVAKICLQKSLFPKNRYVKKVMSASPNVTLKDAVAVADPGINPITFKVTIKKKNVRMSGRNRRPCFSPIFG